MTNFVRQYLLQVSAAAILTAAVKSILPQGGARKTAGFIGSMLLILALLAPLNEIDSRTFSMAQSKIQMEAEQQMTEIEIKNRALLAEIISSKTAAYIEHEATAVGLHLTITVSAETDAAYPYPDHVTLQGKYQPQQREVLSKWISDNLGIKPEDQQWISLNHSLP